MRTIRAAIRFVSFFSATLGLYFIWLVANPFVGNKIAWRQRIFGAWSHSFVRISNMKIEIIGTPPKPPFFLVTNHIGYADVGVIREVAKGIFVAKGEIQGMFLAGRIIRDYGMIFINRSNRRDIPRAGEEIIERLEDGEGVIVFPEGTSTKGEEIIQFNSSFFEFAAQSGIAVSYASLTYTTPPGEMPASIAVSWWDDTVFAMHMWRLFKLPYYNAIIHFGDEPIMIPDRKKLAKELQQRITETFEPVV
jgi:1-acyl-sn-glycerol-3-phosphate acyltransferase